ncbi:AP-1 complex subunit beta [Spathaspora sp. JA1]|nr:AP-1 complex subunit beta [Spathaspora sp. JA1]
MSDGKLFSKSKSVELRAELDQAFKKSKPMNRIKNILRKILANIILNNQDIVNLMSDIIALLKYDDIEIRKLCLEYIVAFASVSEDSVDAIPYLERFRDDSSPILRALALKTMSSINRKEFISVTLESVDSALHDSDPHVRKVAAFAVARLYRHDPGSTQHANLIEKLNELLYDENQTVVANSLAALSSITDVSKSLNLTISKDHALTLISLLANSNEWNRIYLLNSLMSYIPQTEVGAIEMVEHVLPCLQHENSSVVLTAIKVIVYYCNYINNPQLHLPSLSKRLGTSLVSLLSKPDETQFVVLRNVILLLLGRKELVQLDVEMFYCRFDDPIYVKDTKLEIIYLLANESNVGSVLSELEEYATEIDVPMARKAVRAFGNLAIKLENAADLCVEVICDLVNHGVPYIVQEATIILKNILRKYPGRFEFAVEELIKHHDLIEEPDAKTALIWIVGQYCENINEPEVILQEFLDSFKEDPQEVQYATLTTVTKYYLKFPTKGESIVLQVLKWATEEVNNPDIRDRGYIYWRLLSSEHASGPNGEFQFNTKQVILNNNPIISSENDNINPNILDELELNIGSLASIYLKPVQAVFRMAKRKELPHGPTLQPRTRSKPKDSEPNSGPSSRAGSSSPAIGIVRRKSYRRTNSDNVTSTMRSLSLDNTQESASPKKTNFARRLSKRASFMRSRISSSKT